MSRIGIFAAALFAGIVWVGTALAQGVPPRLQGDYAIGACSAPDVTVTIDAQGLRVIDPGSGDTIAEVAVLSVFDGGDTVEMDVVLDGNEDGAMTVTTLGGAIEIVYQPDGGAAEAPQRLELCAAAEATPPPAAAMTAVPDALLGEWVTGSCGAPRDRLVIEPLTLTAYDQGSPQPTAVVDVVDVVEIPGGYLVNADFQGQQIGIELTVVDDGLMELVFIGPDGSRDNPEMLERCSAPQIDTPPATSASLPDAYLGRYAVGDSVSCADAPLAVNFEPQRLVVFEDGTQSLVIDVTGVVATEPDLVFGVIAGGEAGLVTMRKISEASYEVVFTDTQGNADAPEIFTYCDVVDEPPVSPPAVGVIPDEYRGRYVLGEGASCTDEFADQAVFEATRIIATVEGNEEVAEVIAVAMDGPDLVVTVVAFGTEGDIRIHPIGDGVYDTSFTEAGSSSASPPEVMTFCGPGTEVEPVVGSIPDSYLGRYVFDDDPAACDILDGEWVIFEPNRIVLIDDGQEEMVIAVTRVIATEPSLVLAIEEDRLGQAELALAPTGNGTFDVTITEPDGSVEHERFVFCDTAAGPGPQDGPVDAAGGATIPDAYLGRYAFDGGTCDDIGSGDYLLFEPNQLAVYDGGEPAIVIPVTSVIATEPELVFTVDVPGEGPGELAMRLVLGNRYEVTMTGGGNAAVDVDTFYHCDMIPTTDGPVEEVVSLGEPWLGTYVFGDDPALCGAEVPGEFITFEPTRLVLMDGGSEMVITITGVRSTSPNLVIEIYEDRLGEAELELVPLGNGVYDATITEPDGGTEFETLVDCDAAGPVDMPPVDMPPVDTPPVDTPPVDTPIAAELPAAYLGQYVLGDDPTLCDAPGLNEWVEFAPTRITVVDGGEEAFAMTITGVTATEPDLVFGIDSPEDGTAEIVMREVGNGIYELMITAADGDTDREMLSACMAQTEVPDPVTPVATALPDAYLGRYIFDDDTGMGCDGSENEVIFEATRLLVFENGRQELEITVTGVTATEPDLVFTAVVPGEGDVEITLHALGGNDYEVALKEPGSDSADTEVFTFCPVAADGPGDGTDGPMPAGDAEVVAFVFDQSVTDFAAFMADLEAACVPGSEQLCLDGFYGFADVTGDGMLTQAELARLTRFGAKWAVSQNMPQLQHGHKLAIHLATMVTGPLVADGLIYNFDYDGNDALSQIELFPEGAENAPIAVEALMATFTEDTIEQVVDALEVLDDLM